MTLPHDGEIKKLLTDEHTYVHEGEASLSSDRKVIHVDSDVALPTPSSSNTSKPNPTASTKNVISRSFFIVTILLVVVSAICIHLLLQLHSLRRRSSTTSSPTGTLPPIPPVRDICFVHVGKTGGDSIAASMHALQALGSIGGAVEVHTSRDWPRHYKDVVMPSDEETVQTISSGMSPRNMANRNATHEGRHWWSQESGFYAEAATMVRHFRRFGGPLSNATRQSAQYCPATGHVVTWVRDPVSRLVSVWNFADQQKADRNEPLLDDLNAVVEAIADKQVDEETRLSDMFDAFVKVSHATSDMAFFFGNSKVKARTWEQRSTNCEVIAEGSLPLWFVGRTEHFQDDFEALLDKTIDPRLPRISLPHTHSTGRKGKFLSKKSVDLLRRFYRVDYECIRQLVNRGFLGEGYMDGILSETKMYTY